MQLSDCPFCRRRVPPTREGVCPVCRNSIIDGRHPPVTDAGSGAKGPEAPAARPAEVRRVAVASFSSDMEAHAALARVESAGIRASLSDENTVVAYSFYDVAVGGIKVVVAEEDAAKATAVLRDRDSGAARTSPDEAIGCPRCGSRDVETIKTRWKAFLAILLLDVQLFSGRDRHACRSCGHAWTR